MPPRRKVTPEVINTYGYRPRPDLAQIHWDQAAFGNRLPIERMGMTRARMFRRIADTFVPNHFEWHGWTDRVVETLCEHRVVGFPGCSASAKTYNVTAFACTWFWVDPFRSSVMLISTTRDMLRKRAWSNVLAYYSNFQSPKPGNLIASKMIWQSQKGEDKYAIFGKAVEEGPIQKVADDIKGVHTKRQMVIIDEATSVPPAIYEACANLHSYPDEFILILIGNPLNRMDQFGRFCEPERGWTSVTVDTGEWEGKPQEALAGKVPHVVTFDAEKSPNIVEGQIVSRHLPTKEKVESARKSSGGGQTPLYWQNFRGFWPPEGLVKTVFTESALLKHGAYQKHQFTGRNFLIVGVLDPARLGDRPTIRFAKLGEVIGGNMGLEWMKPKVIPVNANSTNPIYFQICEQVKREAEHVADDSGTVYHCEPQCFGVDASGSGSGCADILQRLWSPLVVRIEFGGKASEESVNMEDSRRACDVYKDMVTHMHFRARDAVNSGQLKGVDKETAVELINREFDESGQKTILQSKEDYKEKFKISPDFGDTGVMCLEVAARLGFKLAAIGETAVAIESGSDAVKAAQEVYETADYSVDYREEEDYLEPIF